MSKAPTDHALKLLNDADDGHLAELQGFVELLAHLAQNAERPLSEGGLLFLAQRIERHTEGLVEIIREAAETLRQARQHDRDATTTE